MRKFLLPTDFSLNATEAFHYVYRLFPDDSEFLMLNTFEIPAASMNEIVSLNDKIRSESSNLLRDTITSIISDYNGVSPEILPLSLMGNPVNVIGRLVKENKIDLVVMGMKGEGNTEGLKYGSITAGVIKNVNCTLLAVPENQALVRPKEIVFAADFSSLKSVDMLGPLMNFATSFDAHVYILNVTPPNVNMDMNKTLERLKIDKLLVGIKHSFHFVNGADVVQSIGSFVEDKSVDLLAMVHFQNHTLESMTTTMALNTNIPLLVMHGN